MPWTELPALRNQRSRTYQDDADPLKRAWSGTLAALHYESELDSGAYDTEVNMTPERVNNPQLDGWHVTANGWHYALGRPGDKTTDGWVGFGGRRGAHWFKFRLARIGYLHWPTRIWDDIGSLPTYNRAKLNREICTLTIGPNDDEVSVGSIATWTDIWKTPGGGGISASWRVDSDKLKEEITFNQASRVWIETNRPPSTPLDETWLSLVFEVDWSDIPKVIRDGVLQDLEGDFADDGEGIELRDALGRLLAFMPLSEVRVPLEPGEPGQEERQPLRKRFWKDPDGNHYLLVGVSCDVLAGMPPGDLVFDPTVDKQVAASADDGGRYTGSLGFRPTDDHVALGYSSNADYLYMNGWWRWTGVTIEGTIDVAYMELYARFDSAGTPLTKVFGVDQDNPAAPTSAAEFDADPLTTASVDWDVVMAEETWYQSPSLTTIFQELVDSHIISNDAVMVQVKDDGSGDGSYHRVKTWDLEPTEAGKLHIEYTIVAVGGHMTLWGRYWGP